MEHAAIIILEWLGKVIAARLAGSAVAAVWARLQPTFIKVLNSALAWKQTADIHAKEAEDHEQATDRIEAATKDVPDLLADAAQNIENLRVEIAALKEQNAELSAKLVKQEQKKCPPAGS